MNACSASQKEYNVIVPALHIHMILYRVSLTAQSEGDLFPLEDFPLPSDVGLMDLPMAGPGGAAVPWGTRGTAMLMVLPIHGMNTMICISQSTMQFAQAFHRGLQIQSSVLCGADDLRHS